jgi:hypothetical protein
MDKNPSKLQEKMVVFVIALVMASALWVFVNVIMKGSL